MTPLNNNTQAFFALVRAGLWEQDVRLLPYGQIDFNEVYRLAEEQSVVGLVAAGIEHIKDVKVPQEMALKFAGSALQLEEKNTAMNKFIAVLEDKMREDGIYAILVKGQGIAQCYERPLWRACGDIDFLLNDGNYERAVNFMQPLASYHEAEYKDEKHIGFIINSWVVELHGSLISGLSSRIDRTIDEVQRDVFYGGDVRSWRNGSTQVFLPGINNDSIFVFTHFLKHFYRGGIGLRQICDWCRLLWTFREEINKNQLEKVLRRMKLITEWKAFGALAVDYLGMPSEAMPFYSPDIKWKRKAESICYFILEVGNFGHNRDNSYYSKYPYIVRKTMSLGRRCSDLWRHARIFPMNSILYFPNIVYHGLRTVSKGE